MASGLPRDTTGLIRAGGHTYPAVLLPGISAHPTGAVRADGSAAEVDGELEAAGAGHVETLRDAGAILWDGPVLVYDRVADGAVRCRESSYFRVLATSVAIGAELTAADADAVLADLPLRRRAIHLAGGDPITSGRGRAAAVGLNIAVVATGGGGRHALIGRRSAAMAAMPGMWSFVAGNVEPADGFQPLVSALGREMAEEMPAISGADAHELASRARVHGACFSLGRLGPSLLASTPVDASARDLGRLDAEEFDETRTIDLDDPESCWRGMSPESMVPASAALLAALTADG